MVTPSRRRLQSGQRIRAVVVDDSAVMRHLVARTLEQDPLIEVVGSAPNGAIALDQIAKLNPDVVSLDLEMPQMGGLETLRRIRRDFPGIRVVMFSSHTERGASATFEALSLGADDYVTKTGAEDSVVSLRDSLVPKIKQFFLCADESIDTPPRGLAAETPSTAAPAAKRGLLPVRPKVILIGISTGGPEALAAVLPQIPADFDLPILIVQHMPPLFTRFLCDRLREVSKLPIHEATHGEKLDKPKILIAPGDFHMRLASRVPGQCPEVTLDQGPLENSCRPAADALFSSAVQAFGGATLAIVMTGMGQDGLNGAAALKARGSFVIAQDEATSAVWGMPRAVFQAGLADLVLPLSRIIPEMLVLLAHPPKTSRPGQKHSSQAAVKL